MKYFLCAFLFLNILHQASSQGTLPPGMAYVPDASLNYNYWKEKDQNIYVNDFYASKYLESNYQYRQYVDYLAAHGMDSLLRAAQPDLKVWNAARIDSTERAYLNQHYWSSKEFEHYPVLGLKPFQINAYLEWKTDMLHLASLLQLGVLRREDLPEQFNSQAFRSALPKGDTYHRLFPNYRLPTFQGLMSILPTYGKRKSEKVKMDKKLLAWLQRQQRFRFLIYEPVKTVALPDNIKKALEELGIRPVVQTDLAKMEKWNEVNNLPLLVLEQRFPEGLLEEGFSYISSEKDVAWLKNRPGFNPEKVRLLTIDPDKMVTVSWISSKGRLISLLQSTVSEQPLFGFRAVMTKVD